MEQSVNLYISWAVQDNKFRIELLKHLLALRQSGKVTIWDDSKYRTSDKWSETSERDLYHTDVALLLVSSAYLGSDYRQQELSFFMKRLADGLVQVVPIIIEPCDWQATSLSKVQVLPRNGIPLSEQKELDVAYAEVVKELEELVSSFTTKPRWMQAIEEERKRHTGHLILYDCQLSSIPKEVAEMTWLDTLALSYNQIETIENLSSLSSLRQLQLEHNAITKIEGLQGLSSLQILQLSSNQIKKIEGLQGLSSLQVIYLSSNQIATIEGLQGLSSLETLVLNLNQIIKLEGLEGLSSLQTLDLEANQITKIEGLQGHSSLTNLNLGSNRITKIEGLEDLSSLESFSLNGNKLVTIEGMEKLSSLRWLGLSNNLITKLDGLQSFPTSLTELYLFNNPIENIPQTILGKDANQNCLDDLKSFFAEEPEINVPEVNLILTGNSDVGKTKFATYLTNGKYTTTRNSTHGVIVHPLRLNAATKKEYGFPAHTKITIWDFGGQEYFHNTHQLFFNQNAVYIFLWEKKTNHNAPVQTAIRRDADGKTVSRVLEHFDADYWLSNIQHFAPNQGTTAILVVQNKMDLYDLKKEAPETLPFAQLSRYGCYSQHYISLEKTAQGDKGHSFDFAKLKHEILKALSAVVSQNKEPRTYNEVRKKIDTLSNPYWKVSDYISFIEATKKASPNQGAQSIDNRLVVKHFNEQGKLLYPSDLALETGKVLFTDPQWLSEKMYQILNDAVLERSGFFDEAELEALAHKKKSMSRAMLNQILALMKQYNIIFFNPGKNQYVAPQYLPEVPNSDFSQFKNLLGSPKLVLKVGGFLPKSVVNNIIADYALKDPASGFYKYGVKAIVNGSLVLIEVDYSKRKIYVYTKAPEPYFIRGLFADILKQFKIRIDIAATVGNTTSTPPPSTVDGPVTPPPNTSIFISVDDKVFVDWVALWNGHRSPDGDKEYAVAEDGNRVLRKLYEPFYLPYEQVQSLTVAGQAKPFRLFISYSSKNTDFMQRFVTHLEPLKRNGTISFWYDRMIEPGTKWDDNIKQEMQQANVIVFLLSPDFLATTYIFEHEIPQAIRQQESQQSDLFFVELQACSWKKTGLGRFQQILHPEGTNKAVVTIGEPAADKQWITAVNALEDKIAKRP